MKIESVLVAFLGLGGATLSLRLLTHEVELALLATAVEWSGRRVTALRSIAG